jgi:alkylation response protein AidB-like acyl-CoA dehydrogenase
MDPEELVSRAAGLVSMLREQAARAETLRCAPRETIEALGQAHLLRAPVPKRFGGLGLDFDVILSVAAELGRGCGSTAWVYGVWAADSWLVGMYPERPQGSTGRPVRTLSAQAP